MIPPGVMLQPASVFFQVNPSNSYFFLGRLLLVSCLYFKVPLKTKRPLILGNLIALWQVGIKIIFAVKVGFSGNPAVQSQAG